ITTKEITELTVVDGALVPNVAEDILKIAVVNRYEDAPPALGFVKNFGLKHGAIASCVAHDSHNIIAVGTNDKDLCEAINAIVREKGGVSLANGDEVSTVALPVAGIMSNLDGYEVAEAYEKLDLRSKELGVTLAAPYMTLSFCALLVIPKLKLSDKGLFDGEKFCFTSIYVD
ncbi:MAG: adenine deaminase C-terminal domain-containing protein, partial [Crocinitomicaceae bacterium]|nr:adenine deaminase C-terminal domain-containing protein [Crocinitomicaceae bacterium]